MKRSPKGASVTIVSIPVCVLRTDVYDDLVHVLVLRFCLFFFFFQAEDGIRDLYVTGVQTCALPICRSRGHAAATGGPPRTRGARRLACARVGCGDQPRLGGGLVRPAAVGCAARPGPRRSEERRVGKEWRSGWVADE